MDIQGKEIPFGSFKSSATTTEIDCSNQVTGLYFEKAMVDGQQFIFRIQK